MGRILVTGATGFVGSHLVSTLLAGGRDEVLASSRRRYRCPDGARAVRLDLDDPSTIRPALDGVDVAYYLVHGMETSAFAERDAQAATGFGAAAAAEGARVVYLGGLGDDAVRAPRQPPRGRQDPSGHRRCHRAAGRHGRGRRQRQL